MTHKLPDPPPADNLRGAMWMVGNALCFALAAVGVKKIGTGLPVYEITFLRCLVGMLMLAPAFMARGFGIYRTQRPGLYLVRMGCSLISIPGSYYAVTHLPLATASSLSFTRPLFMILVAIIFLKEIVGWRRGLATAVGFGGVLIILGPSDLADMTASIIALISAAFIAGAVAVIRHQAAIDGPVTVYAWFVTSMTLGCALPAVVQWQTPDLEQCAYLVFIGIVAGIGQYMLIKALATGEATVMNPIDYSQIIFAAVFGYFLFGEILDIWTALGAAVIIASTLYILLREARIKRGNANATVTSTPTPIPPHP